VEIVEERGELGRLPIPRSSPSCDHRAGGQTIMAIAGHVSRQMLEHYSHIRLEAKRRAVEMLSRNGRSGSNITNYVTNEVPGETDEETASPRVTDLTHG